MTAKQIPIKDIRIDGKTQQRDIDTDVVSRYAALMAEGVKFPAVDVIFDGKNYWLWNGFHRYHAHVKNKQSYIEVETSQGTQRDAVWKSFSANHDNGLQKQSGVNKEIIKKILADEEWAKTPEAEIARHIGVTHQYVNKIKKEITAHPATSCKIEPQNKPKNEVSRSNKLNVVRNGKQYEMDKPKEEPKDIRGIVIPENLRPVFERSGEIREFVSTLNRILKTIKEGIAANDLLFAYIKIESLESAFSNAKQSFRFALPYAICPYCGASYGNANCKACNGKGFVNEQIYLATPKELK